MNNSPFSSHPSPKRLARSGNIGIEQRLLAGWKKLSAPEGALLLIAFSGGPDSLALAVALSRIASAAGFQLTALHVDHGLRPTSHSEALSARDLAGALGIDCRIVSVGNRLTTPKPGIGIEEAARRERYLELSQMAQEEGAAYVVTGHHRDDQTETILLHLLRGAGRRGAAGMAPVTRLTVPWWNNLHRVQRDIAVWRPWLSEGRNEIVRYRETIAPQFQPVQDPSNDDTAILRNRLRRELMPILEEVRPGASRAIARFGRVTAMEDELLCELAKNAATDLDRSEEGFVLSELRGLPEPILRRVLQGELGRNGAGDAVTAERLEALTEAVYAGRGNVVLQMGGKMSARLSQGRLHFVVDVGNA